MKSDSMVELSAYYNSFMDSKMTKENRLISQAIASIAFTRNEKMISNTLFMNMTMTGSSLHDVIHAQWNRASIEHAKAITGLPMDKLKCSLSTFGFIHMELRHK